MANHDVRPRAEASLEAAKRSYGLEELVCPGKGTVYVAGERKKLCVEMPAGTPRKGNSFRQKG